MAQVRFVRYPYVDAAFPGGSERTRERCRVGADNELWPADRRQHSATLRSSSIHTRPLIASVQVRGVLILLPCDVGEDVLKDTRETPLKMRPQFGAPNQSKRGWRCALDKPSKAAAEIGRAHV